MLLRFKLVNNTVALFTISALYGVGVCVGLYRFKKIAKFLKILTLKASQGFRIRHS